MAVETDTIAPAPPGQQTTFDKIGGLGPVPVQTKVGDKFRAEFEKLTKPQGQDTKVVESPKEEPKPAEHPKEPPKEVPSEVPPAAEKPIEKPGSPLEAVLAKTPIEKPAEEPDVLKEFDEKTANWQKAREVMKTQSGELKDLRTKLKTFETAPKAEPAVVEALTKERDDLLTRFQQQEDRLKAINAEYSEPFQNLLAAREKDVNKLSTRMKSYGGDADTLIGALSLPEGKVRTAQIKEAMAELDPDDKVTIRALIEKIEGHDDTISDFKKDLPRKWDELQAQREVQLAEQSQTAIKQLETEFRKVADELPNEVVTMREVSDDVPGGTDWNKDIQSADEIALRVLKPNGADFKESAIIAKQGAHYPFLMKRYLQLHSDYSELKKSYNEAAGSGPDFKGGTKSATEAPKKPGIKYREALAIAQASGAGEV